MITLRLSTIFLFLAISYHQNAIANIINDYTDDYEEDFEMDPAIQQDLLRQLDFCTRAGVHPISVVAPLGDDFGRGVVYMGEESLPPQSTVGLYRALLVRKDVWYRWLDDGTVMPEVWYGFWRAYTVEFTGEIDAQGTSENVEKEENKSSMSWMALPVGDVDGDVDGPTWWNYGLISKDNLQKAIDAINNKVLVDWRRLAASQDGKHLLLFNAHIINEPSPNEDENIGHLSGSGCEAFADDDENSEKEIQYCGTAFEAKTSKTIYPGGQFLWCYGEDYKRDYPVASICLNDATREAQK